MAQFFLSASNLDETVPDLEGQDCADLDAARHAAIIALRDLAAGDAFTGLIRTDWVIHIEDESHCLVATVTFEDAIRLAG